MYVYFCILLRCKSFMNLLRQDVWESLWCSCFSLSMLVLCKTKRSHRDCVWRIYYVYVFIYITLSLFFQFEESCRIHSAKRSIFFNSRKVSGAFDCENQCLDKSNRNSFGSLEEIQGDYIHFGSCFSFNFSPQWTVGFVENWKKALNTKGGTKGNKVTWKWHWV